MQLILTGSPNLSKRKSIIGQAVVTLLAAQLLFFSAFVALKLPTATAKNINHFAHNVLVKALPYLPVDWQDQAREFWTINSNQMDEVRYSHYLPEAPVTIFLGYVLGSWLGPLAVLIFLAGGFLGPLIGIYPLAAGGGLDYYNQPGFGYLMGMVMASWLVGRISSSERTSLRQILSVLLGLGCLHLVGLSYLFGSCLVSAFSEVAQRLPVWQPWIFEEARNLSWYTLPYDFVFSIGLVALGFPVKWLVSTLTAPDMGVRNNRSQYIPEELVD